MRVRLLKILTFGAFIFLVFSLAYNQIVRGAYYLQLSQNNRIKLIRLDAPRGSIYDRNAELLAGTRTSFNAALLIPQTRDLNLTLEKIANILEVSSQSLQRQYKKNFFLPFVPVVVAQDISKEKAIILECQEEQISGLVVQTEQAREYLYQEDFCHVLGYLGKVTEDELDRYKIYGLRTVDLVGKAGIEKQFDNYLRGQAGGMQIEVNNRGRQVRVLGEKQPLSGDNLYLTIDAQMQRLANRLFQDKKGACIVLNPQNGEILTLMSRPGFSPDVFMDALKGKAQSKAQIQDLLDSEDAALLNRAISASFPPGSIFKIITACAGLENGVIGPGDHFFCPGFLNIGGRDFFCWKLDGHGSENIYSALAHSCNVFFYKLSLALGVDNLTLFARKFGLGAVTGIDLPYESAGLVPSKAWKLKNYKERWYDGETANFAIGQGYLLATPIQMAQMVSAIANGGYLIRPHLVKEVGAWHPEAVRRKIGLKKENLSVIKEGMYQAISGEHGTAHNARMPGIQWAAKTGTAQAAFGLAHGWFVGFYPLEQPQLAILVFIEHGGSGGDVPATIARTIVEYSIERDLSGDKK